MVLVSMHSGPVVGLACPKGSGLVELEQLFPKGSGVVGLAFPMGFRPVERLAFPKDFELFELEMVSPMGSRLVGLASPMGFGLAFPMDSGLVELGKVFPVPMDFELVQLSLVPMDCVLHQVPGALSELVQATVCPMVFTLILNLFVVELSAFLALLVPMSNCLLRPSSHPLHPSNHLLHPSSRLLRPSNHHLHHPSIHPPVLILYPVSRSQ